MISMSPPILRKRQRESLFSCRSPFLSAFITVSLLFAFAAALFTPFFLVNDDHGQLFLAKGLGFTLEPDDHPVFMNFLVGSFLGFLYRVFPDAGCYPLLLLLIQFLASWAFLSAALLRSKNFFPVLLFFIAFLMVNIGYFLQLNYTLTAALAFQGGLFLLATRPGDKSLGIHSRMAALMTTCFMASFLLRPGAFLVSVLFASPFLLFTLFKRQWGFTPQQLALCVG